MKKLLLSFIALAAVACFYSCRQSAGAGCHIEGVVNGAKYEGKRIFLVPLNGPATAETVDSMEITNGKFHFDPDTLQMYKILLDYHYRFGLQPLILVAEPGTVKIVVDTISHATGTPQNDSLEKWKVQTEIHNIRYGRMRKTANELSTKGETVKADALLKSADSLHIAHKNFTRQMAKNMEGTQLGDFLKGLYPLTFMRKMPDGTTVEINADTHEPVKGPTP